MHDFICTLINICYYYHYHVLSGSLCINSHYVSLLHSFIFCFIQPTLKAILDSTKKAKLRLSSPSSSGWNPSICFIMFHLFWNPHLHHIDRVLLPQHATFDLQEFGAPPVPRFQWWKVPTNWLIQTEQVQAIYVGPIQLDSRPKHVLSSKCS